MPDGDHFLAPPRRPHHLFHEEPQALLTTPLPGPAGLLPAGGVPGHTGGSLLLQLLPGDLGAGCSPV